MSNYEQYIKRLPVIMAFTAGIFAGMLAYAAGLENRHIYFRTAVAIALFYPAGLLVKKTVMSLKKQINVSDKEEKSNLLENIDTEEKSKGKTIDMVADDSREEEFSPMKVSRVIKKDFEDNAENK